MTKYKVWIWLGVFVVLIGIVGIYSDSENQSASSAPVITAPSDEMITSCQSIADAQLRNGAYESLAYATGNTKPSQVSDQIYFDQSKSVCYFTEDVDTYPPAYNQTDAVEKHTKYLYAAAMMPDGTLQDTEAVGWCETSTYLYPQYENQEKCIDFRLKQTGVGTSNYHADALPVGDTVSETEFDALVQQDMHTAP